LALPFARGTALSDQEQVLDRGRNGQIGSGLDQPRLAFLARLAGARQQARTYPLGIESPLVFLAHGRAVFRPSSEISRHLRLVVKHIGRCRIGTQLARRCSLV
jgi:hypothetical protein